MAIAERIDSPQILKETRVICGLMKMLKEIYDITSLTSTVKSPTYNERVYLQNTLNRLILAGAQTADALREWERITGPDYSNYLRFRIKSLEAIRHAVISVGDALASFGVRNYSRLCIRSKVGKWTGDELKSGKRITKKWILGDELLCDKGVYEVELYSDDHFLLDIYRVALASAPVDDPDRLTELSVDEHHGYTERGKEKTKKKTYVLTLNKYDRKNRYFLLADIKGPPARSRSKGGGVSIARRKSEGWDPAATFLAKVRPMTDKELSGSIINEEIGKWDTKDFKDNARITKEWDVTKYIPAIKALGGTFKIRLQDTRSYDLHIYRVALVSAPAGQRDRATELSVDKHWGRTRPHYKSHDNVYTLSLPIKSNHGVDTRYYILADIKRHHAKKLNLNCRGKVLISALTKQ